MPTNWSLVGVYVPPSTNGARSSNDFFDNFGAGRFIYEFSGDIVGRKYTQCTIHFWKHSTNPLVLRGLEASKYMWEEIWYWLYWLIVGDSHPLLDTDMNDAFLLYLEQFFIREAIKVSEDSKDCSNLFMFCSINSNSAYLLLFSSPFKIYPYLKHIFW